MQFFFDRGFRFVGPEYLQAATGATDLETMSIMINWLVDHGSDPDKMCSEFHNCDDWWSCPWRTQERQMAAIQTLLERGMSPLPWRSTWTRNVFNNFSDINHRKGMHFLAQAIIDTSQMSRGEIYGHLQSAECPANEDISKVLEEVYLRKLYPVP